MDSASDPLEQGITQQGCLGFGIGNLSRSNHRQSSLQVNHQGFDKFVRLESGLRLFEVRRDKKINLLITKADAAVDKAQTLEAGGVIPDLFDQFTTHAGHRIFTRLKTPGRDLADSIAYRWTKLADQQQAPICHHR